MSVSAQEGLIHKYHGKRTEPPVLALGTAGPATAQSQSHRPEAGDPAGVLGEPSGEQQPTCVQPHSVVKIPKSLKSKDVFGKAEPRPGQHRQLAFAATALKSRGPDAPPHRRREAMALCRRERCTGASGVSRWGGCFGKGMRNMQPSCPREPACTDMSICPAHPLFSPSSPSNFSTHFIHLWQRATGLKNTLIPPFVETEQQTDTFSVHEKGFQVSTTLIRPRRTHPAIPNPSESQAATLLLTVSCTAPSHSDTVSNSAVPPPSLHPKEAPTPKPSAFSPKIPWRGCLQLVPHQRAGM